jgi:hypothetical protein
MAFIKTHLISLVCGLAALIFIGIAAWGMTRDSVAEQMRARAAVQQKIRALKSTARNQESINAEAQRGQRFQQEYEEVLAVAKEINQRPLIPVPHRVFPVAEGEYAAYFFAEKYREEVLKLPALLHGGDLPTAAEIQEAANDIAELLAREAELLAEGGVQAPPIAAAPATSPETVDAAGGLITAVLGGDPKRDARIRANVTKARTIRCYVRTDPDAEDTTFHISPIWDAERMRPTPAEMWFAQVGLWIQQDIVAAIARLNDEAARRLDPEEAFVENMPVKRLQAIRLLGYWTESGPLPFSIRATSRSAIPLASGEAFTRRASDDQFDVVRFTVVAVVDQRELLALIDAISKQNFYQLIEISCEAVSVTDPDYDQGYIYGAAPVVRATLHCEGYMARNVYEALFPPDVRVALGISDSQTDGRGGRRP